MADFLAKMWIETGMVVKFLIAAIWIILVVIVAKIIAWIVWRLIRKCTFIENMFHKVWVDLDMTLIAKVISKTLYIVLIIGAIIAWGAYAWVLSQDSLGAFINNYLLTFLNAAGLAIVSWILAVLAKSWIMKALESTELDEKLGAKTDSSVSVSESLGTVGFWWVILFFLPQVLSKLGQDELLSPITGIINQITDFIPSLIWAGIIVAVAYFVWKFISKLITELLSGLGFDKVLGLIWMKNTTSKTSPSSIVWKLVFVYIVLLAALEAADKLGFTKLSEIVNNFMWFGTNILVWVIIFGIWMYLANLAATSIKGATNSTFLPKLAKGAIIVLTAFMWLQQMWLGWDIINQAFTLLLGAAAVAFALAVWLGSKEIAWEEVKKFINSMRK